MNGAAIIEGSVGGSMYGQAWSHAFLTSRARREKRSSHKMNGKLVERSAAIATAAVTRLRIGWVPHERVGNFRVNPNRMKSEMNSEVSHPSLKAVGIIGVYHRFLPTLERNILRLSWNIETPLEALEPSIPDLTIC